MNTNAIRCVTLGAAFACAGWSQEMVVPPPSGQTIGFISAGGAPSFRVMGIGGIEGKTVVGAPYSAEEVTETVHTLGDGNRIVNTAKVKVFRDQQGRQRVEQTMANIGGLTAAEVHDIIMIDDPTANVHYTLHPHTRTAEKVETVSTTTAKEGATIAKLQAEAAARMKQAQVDAGPHIQHMDVQEMHGVQQIEMSHLRMTAGADVAGTPAAVTLFASSDNSARSEESLGTQNMEGLMVQGKRTTTTIPAGTIGNERPIEIVDERWYSPELQMNIMTKHSDPRMGETVFSVKNVSRANPDSSLFQLPTDYQVNSSKNMIYKFNRAVTTKP